MKSTPHELLTDGMIGPAAVLLNARVKRRPPTALPFSITGVCIVAPQIHQRRCLTTTCVDVGTFGVGMGNLPLSTRPGRGAHATSAMSHPNCAQSYTPTMKRVHGSRLVVFQVPGSTRARIERSRKPLARKVASRSLMPNAASRAIQIRREIPVLFCRPTLRSGLKVMRANLLFERRLSAL